MLGSLGRLRRMVPEELFAPNEEGQRPVHAARSACGPSRRALSALSGGTQRPTLAGMGIKLIVCDMAGTTVEEHGTTLYDAADLARWAALRGEAGEGGVTRRRVASGTPGRRSSQAGFG